VSASDDGSLGVALAAADVGSHLAREKDGLLVSAHTVARARAQFSQFAWWGERPVGLAVFGEALGVVVVKVILGCGGSATLEFTGPWAGGGEIRWERRRWRGHGWLL